MKGMIQFTEPLPRNDRRDTHTDTDLLKELMKYAVEMGGGGVPGTDKHNGDRISLLFSFLFKIRKLR
jgi:hypothetical protein